MDESAHALWLEAFAIFLPWALARIMWMGAHAVPSNAMLVVAFVLDMLFWGLTSFAVIRAVWAARQKRQIGIVAKLTLLYIAQLAFYVGVFTNHLSMQQASLYAALYLVIGVVFTIGRRVLPFLLLRASVLITMVSRTASMWNKKFCAARQGESRGTVWLYCV